MGGPFPHEFTPWSLGKEEEKKKKTLRKYYFQEISLVSARRDLKVGNYDRKSRNL
jgi:hypothetical protein